MKKILEMQHVIIELKNLETYRIWISLHFDCFFINIRESVLIFNGLNMLSELLSQDNPISFN